MPYLCRVKSGKIAYGRALLGLLCTALLCLAGGLIWHFYFLLPHSDSFFRIRHHGFAHLEMHTDRYGYLRSESVGVALSVAPAQPVRLRMFNAIDQATLWQDTLRGEFQPLPEQVSVKGTGWRYECVQPWSDRTPSGWYVLEAQAGGFTRRTSLFLQPAPGAVQPRVALLLSTHTWNAYNYWGGQSIYTHQNYTPTVSFERPQLLADPFLANSYPHHQLYYQAANKDRYLAQLLDSAGLGYDVYSMMALERDDPRLADYDVLIMATHSEYWSERMLRHLNRRLDAGASLLCLAGNVAAYRTTFDPDARQMTIYREVEELWQTADTANLRPFGQQAAFLGFHTYAPYQVRDSSWLLAGTGLQPGDLLGEVSDTYDYTYMYSSWAENLLGLLKRGQRGAAAGLEVDRPYAGTPTNWVTVAQGLNPAVEGHGEVYPDPTLDWDGAAGPDLGYYWHPGGGLVLSVGSMAFTGALPYDPHLRQVVLNALQRALSVADASTK